MLLNFTAMMIIYCDKFICYFIDNLFKAGSTTGFFLPYSTLTASLLLQGINFFHTGLQHVLIKVQITNFLFLSGSVNKISVEDRNQEGYLQRIL